MGIVNPSECSTCTVWRACGRSYSATVVAPGILPLSPSFTETITHHVSYPFLSISLFALSRAFSCLADCTRPVPLPLPSRLRGWVSRGPNQNYEVILYMALFTYFTVLMDVCLTLLPYVK